MTRRNAATIVATDVQTPSPNVFAGCMNTATVREGRCDMLVTKVGENYLLDARTDKGEALLEGTGFAEAGESSLARREQVWDDNERLLKKHALNPKPSDLPELLEKNYEHPVWQEKADLCFSCGSCNTTCPTCYCFDVQDDVDWDLESGKRFRKWDACLLTNFATVAGDHNFRKNRAARYRHRYYRKGKYVPGMIDEIACVGCGRCITACVAKIANPVEVFNRLLEEK
jgi:ferredoxin